MNTTTPAEITPFDQPPHWPDDRPRRTFQLTVTESTGPFVADNGDETGQTCPGCGLRPVQGEQILRFGDQWWHLRCAQSRMRKGGADAAWLMLGVDLAARPSCYSVAETRAIVRALLRLTPAVPSAPEN